MPPEEGAVPETVAPVEAPASSPTDEQVAQNWFDEWSGKIEERLGHLEQAITHVAQSQKEATSNVGPPSSQPSNPPRSQTPARRSSPPPANSQSQQPIQEAPAVPTGTTERSPDPSHWYFKRIWGKR